MRLFYCLLLLPILSQPLLTQANNGSVEAEIRYLKQFIQSSSCKFIRNDSSYSANEALDHIEKKYQYFNSRITSAEQFIELSASKSTLSGRPYRVICKGEYGLQTLNSKTWLLRALTNYREKIK